MTTNWEKGWRFIRAIRRNNEKDRERKREKESERDREIETLKRETESVRPTDREGRRERS